MKKPNFFLVGAAKAGTTSLYEYLKSSNEIFLPNIKEPNYFGADLITEDYPDYHMLKPIRDEEKYYNLYKNVKNELAIGDCTAWYLPDKKAANKIHNFNPTAKIIILLRNPIDRTYSHYLMNLQSIETRSFHEVIHKMGNEKSVYDSDLILRLSFYYDDVKRYFDVFGNNQVMVIIFEEFKENTSKYLKQISNFLGLKNTIQEDRDIHNPYSVPKNKIAKFILSNETTRRLSSAILSPPQMLHLKNKFLVKKSEKEKMSEEDRIYLQNLFSKDVKKLETLLSRKLPW